MFFDNQEQFLVVSYQSPRSARAIHLATGQSYALPIGEQTARSQSDTDKLLTELRSGIIFDAGHSLNVEPIAHRRARPSVRILTCTL